MSRLLLTLAALTLSGTMGCDIDNGSLVHVFSTHHASEEDGSFPIRGSADSARVFDNDEGWSVALLEGIVVTAGATLVSCDGDAYDLDMFWGPCAENMRAEDLAASTVAGLRVPSDDYCFLEVEYGTYVPPEDDEENRHVQPEPGSATGNTILLRGAANGPDGTRIEFDLRSSANFVVSLDLRDLDEDGDPLTISGDDAFPSEITVSKTYDQFFEGIDFQNYSPSAAAANLPATLTEETRVSPGTQVRLLQ
jgi:hypothetical protein